MGNIKKWLHVWAVLAILSVTVLSCKNNSTTVDNPPPTVYAPPVVQPLKFSKTLKINWDSIKAIPVHPVVKPFDLDKLPTQRYDTGGFKPFKYPVEVSKLNLDNLPEKDLDIDKLPSRLLKFTTIKLPPPTLIHSGPPHIKDLNLSLFELGSEQGLPGDGATSLLTDRDGFLWIANSTGLYRYDGENLLLYMPVTTPHWILDMALDAKGRIWLTKINNGGLEIFDPQKGILQTALSGTNMFYSFMDHDQRIWIPAYSPSRLGIIDTKTLTIKWIPQLANTTAVCIAQDHNYNIWISTTKGLDILDLNKNKISYINRSNGLRSDSAGRLLFDSKGRLWTSLEDGILQQIDFKKKTVETIKEIWHPNARILDLFQDGQGQVWVGAFSDGLVVIDPEKRTVLTLKNGRTLNSDNVIAFEPDHQGQLWIGEEGGLNIFSFSKTIAERIGKSPAYYLSEDKLGFEWLITTDGADLINRKDKTVIHLSTNHGFPSSYIGLPTDVNDKIYIPSFSGLNIIDPSRKTITQIGKAEGFSGQTDQTSNADKRGRLWIGELDGIAVFTPADNTFKHLGNSEGLNSTGVGLIQTGQNGEIWFGENSGEIGVIDPIKYTIRKINASWPHFKNAGVASSFLVDKRGNIWIGTAKGIFVADLKNKTLTAFSVPQGLIDERVGTLLEYGGKIYASTVRGITVITPPAEGIVSNKKWGVQSFGREYGLTKLGSGYPGTDAISADGHFLWADYGLTVLDLTKKDTTRPPAYISGMNIMDQPANFSARSRASSNGIVWDEANGPFNMPEGLVLPHDQNYVQFNFGTLNFVAHDTTWYSYKLVGKDTSWSAKTTGTLSRNYFSLPPGKYTFEVASKTAENDWSKSASFSFVIIPPWWQTWWAYTLYTLLFGGIIWGIVSYRSYQLMKEKRVLEHKVHIRTEEVLQQKEEIEAQRDNLEKAFYDLKKAQTQLIQSEKMASLGELTAGIAHEIQNPLNFVNNFSEVNIELVNELKEGPLQQLPLSAKANADEIIGSITENIQKVSYHGKRADAIVKAMLQHSRSSSGQKEPTNINSLADEYLRLAYHGLRAKDKSFNATTETDFDNSVGKLNIIPQDIGRVILNLLNNAFYAANEKKKRQPAGYEPTVAVRTKKLEDRIEVSVRDNGNGIPQKILDKIYHPFFTTKPTGQGTGLGLSMSYDIVKAHSGELRVETVEGEFTEFTIQLPIISN